MTTPTAVDDVTWDIDPLLPVPGRAGVDQLLDEAEVLVGELEMHRGRIGELDAAGLAELFGSVAALSDMIGRAGSYVGLAFAVDTAEPEIGALMQAAQERTTAMMSRLIFIDLEWASVDDDAADALLADPQLAFVAHHLRGIRRYRPHLLSEPEEVVLAETSITGASAWSRLFTEQSSAIDVELDGDPTNLMLALSGLQSDDADRRRTIAEAVTAGLEPGLRVRGYIYNTLLADKMIDDRLRGYPSWIASMNLANEASDASVQALVDAVVGRYDIPQRWYALKARLLGVERLHDWDRMAPVVQGDAAEFSWDDAKDLVLDAYHSFSPQMADVVRRFFDEPWIDAPVRASKQGGAFCAYTVASHHPYLLLNWTSKRRDVLTLAHELGHGVHAYLARGQGIFHQSTPLTLAETASVFGETVTFGRLLNAVTDPAERLPLLAEHLEDQIATVFRQVAMNRFEDSVHNARRDTGELSIDRFGELWAASQSAMLGDAVEISVGYRTWWSYIPHFIHTPGYVYAYAYGQLLALSVYARFESEGEAFVPSYVEMLSAGGSMAPEDLGRIVGVDLGDPAFWDGGLAIIDRHLTATEDAARAAGRIA